MINGNIPFGHKISLHPIAMGEAIIKYGVKIGVATSFIEKGEHVHVHNCK
jgi:altronate dehydratase